MKLKYLKNVASLALKQEDCIGCGKCLEVCPHQIFEMHQGKAMIAERDACMECGACQKNCVVGAIFVKSGVGCAAAVVNGFLRGTEPDCGCGSNDEGGSCCC